MRNAIVDSAGHVVNVTVIGGEWQPPEGHLAIPSEEAGIGWTWDGAKFHPPADTTPLQDVRTTHLSLLGVAADAQMKQRAIYAEKFAQALAFQANPDLPLSDVPLIEASIGFDGDTAADVAAVIVAKYTAAVTHAAAVERVRLGAERAIRNASTVQGVRDAYEAIAWPTP